MVHHFPVSVRFNSYSPAVSVWHAVVIPRPSCSSGFVNEPCPFFQTNRSRLLFSHLISSSPLPLLGPATFSKQHLRPLPISSLQAGVFCGSFCMATGVIEKIRRKNDRYNSFFAGWSLFLGLYIKERFFDIQEIAETVVEPEGKKNRYQKINKRKTKINHGRRPFSTNFLFPSKALRDTKLKPMGWIQGGGVGGGFSFLGDSLRMRRMVMSMSLPLKLFGMTAVVGSSAACFFGDPWNSGEVGEWSGE